MFLTKRLVGAVLLSLLLSGCTGPDSATPVTGSGRLRTEDRTVQGFERLEIKNYGSAIVHFGSSETLTIEADENLFEYVVAEVSGGTLKVGVQDNLMLTGGTLKFTITTKALTGLAINGAGSIEAPNINTPRLEVSVNGAGSFHLSGTADVQTIRIDGGGSFNGSALNGREAVVVISGAGSADLNITDRLDVTISGAGSVMYTGSPEVKQNISGMGSIQQVNR